MHSSEILSAKHFEYVLLGNETGSARDFSVFCPDYKDTDRLGTVSPCYEEGVLGAGYAILAFVTAFYDAQRSRSNRFFIYPQHFAFFLTGIRKESEPGGTASVLQQKRPWRAGQIWMCTRNLSG